MKNRALFKTLALAAAAVLLGSCVLFGGRTARDTFVAEARRGDLSRAPLALEETTVLKGAESERIRENAAYILTLLFERKKAEEKESLRGTQGEGQAQGGFPSSRISRP